MRAGLIPSRALQERRIVQERNEINGVDTDKEGIFKKFNHSQLLKITKKKLFAYILVNWILFCDFQTLCFCLFVFTVYFALLFSKRF